MKTTRHLLAGVFLISMGALALEVLPRDVFGTGKIPQGPGYLYLASEWTTEPED